ncbi:MAG: HNH endonuclease signature motif containing protein [Verrucomicrobia bacterium]|nr:HNH endonuclease signature motif containing protein [Verrucomicrobiota bacterium]
MNFPLHLMKRAVLQRAGGRCEYCGLSQAGQEARFHVDHIHPRAEGGATALDNLALACVPCSLRKGARCAAPDPLTGKPAPLFHPRRQVWGDHFQWQGCRVLGRTPTGRATVHQLKMSRLLAQAIRAEEALRGRHPPPTPAK